MPPHVGFAPVRTPLRALGAPQEEEEAVWLKKPSGSQKVLAPEGFGSTRGLAPQMFWLQKGFGSNGVLEPKVYLRRSFGIKKSVLQQRYLKEETSSKKKGF